MGGREKPFVMYRRSAMHFSVVPRGAKGWAQFAFWIGLLVLHLMWFGAHVDGLGLDESLGSGLFLFCVGVLAWLICGLWWMCAHAEVVDAVVLKRDRQRRRREEERERQRQSEGAQDS